MEDPVRRLEFLFTDWDGAPLSREDATILSEALPVMAEAFQQVAPTHFPDGTPTGAQRLLKQLGTAALNAIHDAAQDNDYETVHDLWTIMKAVKQPQAMPVFVGWVDTVGRVRERLESRGRDVDKRSVEAAAQVNQRWWELNGQWEQFTDALVAATTPEQVSKVVIFPPDQFDSRADSVQQAERTRSGRTHDCPDCGGLVSNRAQACPHCGCPNHELEADRPFGEGPRVGETATQSQRAKVAEPPPANDPTRTRKVWIWVGTAAGAGMALILVANQLMGLTIISGQKAASVVAKRLETRGGAGFRVTCPTRIVTANDSFLCPIVSATGQPAGAARVVVVSPSGGLNVDLTPVETNQP